MIAIGRPGDRLPPLGAARTYVSDDEWQREVRRLSSDAQAIVVRAGASSGLEWEIGMLLQQEEPEKLLFVFFIAGLGLLGPIDAQRASSRERDVLYSLWLEQAWSHLHGDVRLPESLGENSFLSVDRNWQPYQMKLEPR